MHPIKSGSSWTVAKILSTSVHIILTILIIGAGLSVAVQHKEPLGNTSLITLPSSWI
jgi:hypothetical protein